MSLYRRITNLFSRSRVEQDIEDELRSHIEMRVEDNLGAGMSPEQARRDALLRFGNPVGTKERVAAMDVALALENIWSDIRYALRQVRKFPIFAATTVLTLALGMGATTAIFTVMNAVLLRSLPVPNPQQVFYLNVPTEQPYGAWNTGNGDTSFSRPVFEALRQDRRAFSDVMAFVPLSSDSKVAVRIGNDSPEQASGNMVSGNFFSGLGAPMARGRGFTLDDEKQHAAVAVLNYAYWTRRFSRSPGALGQTIYIKGLPFTIIGVAGQDFPGVEPGQLTDLWIPLQSSPALSPWGESGELTLYGSPNWWCLMLIARLAPGITAAQAVAEATPAFQAAAYASLGTPDPKRPKVALALVPAKGIQGLGDNYREPITILMALVTLVLSLRAAT